MSDHDSLFDDLGEETAEKPPAKPKKSSRKKTPPPEPEPTFEEALERLEKVVGEMEGGKLPIEECIKRFEEGSKLAAFCTKSLNDLERRVQILVDAQTNEWRDLTEDEE